MIALHNASCVEWLAAYDGPLFDSCVTDPPYELGFMGKAWDSSGVAFSVDTWRAVYNALKPGAHLVAFSGTRTYHRMACAIEDAGFEIRDMAGWLYGSGFPKSLDVSKALDKAAGVEFAASPAEGVGFMNADGAGGYNKTLNRLTRTGEMSSAARQWQGYGTALKPAQEPICIARKPLSEKTVAANVLKWGTGALNIDGCRVEAGGVDLGRNNNARTSGTSYIVQREAARIDNSGGLGRWPANIIHDGSDEVLAVFPETGAASGGHVTSKPGQVFGGGKGLPAHTSIAPSDNGGSAARFFYSAQYSEQELLLYRAKAKVEQWNSDLASTADNSTHLSSEAVASALSDAVTWAFRATVKSFQAPSTSATPTELRRISETAIAAMLIIESGCSHEWRQEKLILNDCRVRIAETQKLTGIITITISHWKSNGCADPVTFCIIPQNVEAGAADCAPLARRFHYSAKAGPLDRIGTSHATVKPVDTMRWLARLVTPKGGHILEPFAGSGTTGIAAMAEGFDCTMIELLAEHCADIERKLAYLRGEGASRIIEHTRHKRNLDGGNDLPLFAA